MKSMHIKQVNTFDEMCSAYDIDPVTLLVNKPTKDRSKSLLQTIKGKIKNKKGK